MVSDAILGNLYETWSWNYRKDGKALPTDNKTETKKKIKDILLRVSSNLESKIPSDFKGIAYLKVEEKLNILEAYWLEEKNSDKKAIQKYNFNLEVKKECLKQGYNEEQSNALTTIVKKYLFNMGMDLSDNIKLLQNGWDTVWLKKDL